MRDAETETLPARQTANDGDAASRWTLSGSGPKVARLFQCLLAIIFLVAWASLGVQLDVLVGSHGLLPAAPFIDGVRSQLDPSFLDFPTLFRWGASDGVLTAGVFAGVALSLLCLAGLAARAAFAVNTLLYLSYALVCRTFLSFQWDNLLLECGMLAAFLPAERPAPVMHFLLRAALFKLYFESGIAKWQSYLGDWQDGSAMTYYYETAPIPTWLAWYLHHMPVWWHHFESRATLAFEILGPLFIFTPRPTRLFVFTVFTGFQLINISSANYGFFSYLALVLHVFLLDDRDILLARAAFGAQLRRIRGRLGKESRRVQARARLALHELRTIRARITWTPKTDDQETFVYLGRLGVAIIVTTVYLSISLQEGIALFWEGGPQSQLLAKLRPSYAALRVINNYHLFGHITRERIEPNFETFDGSTWTTFDLHYKPGDPERAPPFVAPHQPRVDFLLWFYGLSHERGVPEYVGSLLVKMCTEPKAVQSLFVAPLPSAPAAVRVKFYEYHFTSAEEKSRTGASWTRRETGNPRILDCSRARHELR